MLVKGLDSQILHLLKPPIAVLISALLLYCCDGGPSTQPSGEDRIAVSITLSWSPPSQRLNGTALSTDDISGYVIVLIAKSELNSQFLSLLSPNPPTAAEFMANPNIGDYIDGDELPSMIETGSPFIILVSPGSTNSYTLDQLTQDRYYFAISAYDYDYTFSALSSTISLETSSN